MPSPKRYQPRIRISHFTAQGGRNRQEDRIFIQRLRTPTGRVHGYFIAILDGHGGSAAADTVIEMLPASMAKCTEVLSHGQEKITEFLRELCASLHEGTRELNAGTTFTGTLVDLKAMIAYTAHIGDSILFIARDGAVAMETTTHNARANLSDRKIMIERGTTWDGYYLYNGDYGIQCTRTLGDNRIPQIIREPEIGSFQLQHGDTLVLATDGVISTCVAEACREEIANIAIEIKANPTLSAEGITYHGMEICAACDNATTILVRIK